MAEHISVKVASVDKKLGKNQALKDLSLYFSHAKMHGVIGPEGAGKTTLMRILLGLLKPDAGSVKYIKESNKENKENKENEGNKEDKDKQENMERFLTLDEIRYKVSYMPQQQSLYPDLSIDEHLDFFRRLYQINTHDYREKRKELLDITQLGPFVERPASKLSGGMYKKLGLMCVLLRSPEVILLDEPTNGVDPISRREFWDLLYRLLDRKILIIVTTSYMDEAERCSMVHLMDAGSCIAEGDPKEILEKEKMNSFEALFLKLSQSKSNTKITSTDNNKADNKMAT